MHALRRFLVFALGFAVLTLACTTDKATEPPTPGSINGQIGEAGSGAPIAGVNVSTQPATATVTTDAQGNYTIPGVAPGGYAVTAAKSGYQNGSANATVVAGQTATANIALTPLPTTGTISGTVTDASNSQPIAGATVTTQPATSTALTDAQGNYSIANVTPGSYTLRAARAGYTSNSTGVVVTAGQTSTANLALTPTPPPTDLSGRWVGTTSQNRPLILWVGQAGVMDSLRVQISVPIISGISSCLVTFTPVNVSLASDASFTAALASPTQVSGTLSGTFGTGTTASGAFQAGWSGGIICGGTLTIGGGGSASGTWQATKSSTGTISGRVTDASSSQPIAGATVSTQPVTATVATDAQGNYTIPNVAPGGYTVTAAKSGYQNGASNVTVAAGQTATANLQLTLPATRLFLSPILDFKLSPNPTTNTDVTVELCLSTMAWSATLAEDMVGTSYAFNLGVRTAFNSSGTGTLQADIIHKRGSTETLLASTTFTTTTTYEVKTAALTGPDPDALAGDILLLRVRIVPPSPGLPCVAEFIGPGTDNFIEVPRTTVQLLPTTGTIAGRVTDASSSQPIAGATVSTQPVTATVTTDAQGNYTIPNVAPGGYTVNAAKSGYQNGSASATVVAGQTATASIALTPLPTTGTISGTVTDANNNQPIVGATVTTQPATATVLTDAQGNYRIASVAPGSYTLSAARAGYNSNSMAVVVTAGQTSTANLALTPAPPSPDFNGLWSGTTSQGSSVSFTILNNAVTLFSIGFSVTGTLCTASGTGTITFTIPQPITGTTFLIVAPGTPLSITASGTFNSNTSAGGSASFTFVQAACVATGSTTWTATKQ